MFDWFNSYLNEGLLRVKVNPSLSDSRKFILGVPQDAISIPCLSGIVTTSTEDITITYSDSSLQNLIADVNHDLSLLLAFGSRHIK